MVESGQTPPAPLTIAVPQDAAESGWSSQETQRMRDDLGTILLASTGFAPPAGSLVCDTNVKYVTVNGVLRRRVLALVCDGPCGGAGTICDWVVVSDDDAATGGATRRRHTT